MFPDLQFFDPKSMSLSLILAFYNFRLTTSGVGALRLASVYDTLAF